MDIKDAHAALNQSRLERGLLIAHEAAEAVSGARTAAAIGRGRGYLAVPLTWDNEAVLSFLKALDGSSLTGRSTNLEALIDAAADAFQSSSPARKIIVLVSDGEAVDGLIRNALNRCVRENIIVITVAVGSDAGTIVPWTPSPVAPNATNADIIADNNPLVIERDAVISRRDTVVMRMAAERTGGIFIDGNRDDAPSALSSHLLSIAHETSPGSSRPAPKERRTMFVILAVIAFGASKFALFVPEKTSGRGRNMKTSENSGGGFRSSLVSLAAILMIFTSCSEGKLLLVEANYLHSRGRYDEALIPYLKALNFEDSAPYAEYGLGLTF
jgi:Ca-activated chloride channel family protein